MVKLTGSSSAGSMIHAPTHSCRKCVIRPATVVVVRRRPPNFASRYCLGHACSSQCVCVCVCVRAARYRQCGLPPADVSRRHIRPCRPRRPLLPRQSTVGSCPPPTPTPTPHPKRDVHIQARIDVRMGPGMKLDPQGRGLAAQQRQRRRTPLLRPLLRLARQVRPPPQPRDPTAAFPSVPDLYVFCPWHAKPAGTTSGCRSAASGRLWTRSPPRWQRRAST